MNINPFSAR